MYWKTEVSLSLRLIRTPVNRGLSVCKHLASSTRHKNEDSAVVEMQKLRSYEAASLLSLSDLFRVVCELTGEEEAVVLLVVLSFPLLNPGPFLPMLQDEQHGELGMHVGHRGHDYKATSHRAFCLVPVSQRESQG